MAVVSSRIERDASLITFSSFQQMILDRRRSGLPLLEEFLV